MLKKIHPYIKIILTFALVIITGTIVLALPISSSSGKSIGVIDSLFTATSATCVTGLTTINIAKNLSLFGKIVLMVLMEVGGLSIITITVFFFTILGAKIGISNRFLLREQLNQSSVDGILSLVKRIVIISFTIQILFSFINYYPFYLYLKYCRNNNLLDMLGFDGLTDTKLYLYSYFISIFHSAASFNNAGFDILGDNSFIAINNLDNVMPIYFKYTLNLTTIFMIILGGIGFVVYTDVYRCRFKFKKFSLHTKIVLTTTFLLIVFGSIFIYLSANFVTNSYFDVDSNMLINAPKMSPLEALFTSVSLRTAGFYSYDMKYLTGLPVTYILSIILMLIGASPCSTGGGIKTTTFAVVVISIYYYARGRDPKAFKRRISEEQRSKAFVLILTSILIVLLATILVVAIQPNLGIQKVLFEVVSAFSTTGCSMGITTSLCAINKAIITLMMFFGRLGPLTIIGVLNKNWMNNYQEEIKFAKENVIIG